MKRPYFLFLFLHIMLPTLVHGMDLVLCAEEKNSNDICCKITQWLYIGNNFTLDTSGKQEYIRDDEYVICRFGRDIQTLTCTNHFLFQWFSNEEIAKNIITILTKHRERMCEDGVARHLNSKGGVFYAMHKKIERLFDIVTDADQQFTEDDLQDPWYVNATCYQSHGGLRYALKKYRQRDLTRPKQTGSKIRFMVETYTPFSLLSMACKVMDFEKIQAIIAAGAHCKNHINTILLLKFTENRSRLYRKHKNRKLHYFAMAQLLLQHGVDPNYSYSANCPTPLMITAYNNDQELAYLLLQYNANPYRIAELSHITVLEYPFWHHEKEPVKVSALDVEKGKPKDWLMQIIESITQQRGIHFKYWFLKNYEINCCETMHNIPLDVVQLIMNNISKSYTYH